MEILNLNLKAFGPFTDQKVELVGAGETAGLHVIYGANESGKSSARRALRDFFFKIPGQTDDNFLHEYGALRIGLGLRFADGTQRELYRRKGNKRTLSDAAGVVSEDVLGDALGGLSRESYLRSLNLDAQELREGADELLSGGGELGQALFAASLGSRELRLLLRELDKEADALFSGRRGRRISQLVGEVKDLRRQAAAASLPTAEWAQKERALAEQSARLVEIQAELRQTGSRRERLARLERAIPLLLKREAVLEDLSALHPDELPILRQGFAEARAELQGEAGQADRDLARVAAKLVVNQAEHTQLLVDDNLLAYAERLSELSTKSSAQRRVRADLTVLRGRIQGQSSECERNRLVVAPDLTSEDLLASPLPSAAKRRVERLGKTLGKCREALTLAREELPAKEQELQQAEADFVQAKTTVAASPPSANLDRALVLAQRAGDLDDQVEVAERSAQVLRRDLEARVERLPRTEISLEALLDTAFPDIATIEEHGKQHQSLRSARAKLEESLASLKARRVKAESQLEALELTQEVPSPEDLEQARALRAETWDRVRVAWSTQRSPEEVDAEADSDLPLAEAFERRVSESDRVADRLWHEAEAVTKKAALRSDLGRLREDHLEVARQLDLSVDEVERAQQTWRDLWAAHELKPGSPAELLAWRRDVELIRADSVGLRRAEEDSERLTSRRASLIQDLESALSQLGVSPPSTSSLDACVALSKDEAKARAAAAEALSEAEARVGTLRSGVVALRATEVRAKTALDAAEKDWREACAELSLNSDLEPAEAREQLAERLELEKRLRDLEELRGKAEALSLEVELFEQAVVEVLGAAAPDLAAQAPSDGIEEAARRLVAVRQESVRRDGLVEARETLLSEQDEAQALLRDATAGLEALCLEGGVDDPAALPELEARVRSVGELRVRLEAVEATLRELSAGQDLATLTAAAAEVNADELPARQAELKADLVSLEEQRSGIEQQVGGLRQALEVHDGRSDAASYEEEARARAADLQAAIDRWVELRASRVFLNREIERYTQEHQGPLLERASKLFASLTLGSFASLTSESASDTPVLLGVRRDGEQVRVEYMSAGTREQLYLSLRIASLALQQGGGEVLPLVVDDVLLHSDDQRSVAILEALKELSRTRQVLLFTHRRRLYEHALGLGGQVKTHLLGEQPAALSK